MMMMMMMMMMGGVSPALLTSVYRVSQHLVSTLIVATAPPGTLWTHISDLS